MADVFLCLCCSAPHVGWLVGWSIDAGGLGGQQPACDDELYLEVGGCDDGDDGDEMRNHGLFFFFHLGTWSK